MLAKIRRQGLLHTIEQLFNRLVPSWLFRFSVGDILNLDQSAMTARWNSNASDPTLCFQRIEDAGEKEQLRIQTWNSVPLSTSADDIGYRVADHASGDSLGGVWIAKDSFAESDLGFLIQLRPEQSWLYCAFVESAARRRGVYQRLLGFAATDAQSGGSEQLLVIIQPWNKASMHVHRKYATGTIGRIAVLRIGPLTWVMTFGAAKKSASLTLQPARHPVKIWIG